MNALCFSQVEFKLRMRQEKEYARRKNGGPGVRAHVSDAIPGTNLNRLNCT